MTDHVLKVESGHYFVSPFYFVLYAEDFYEASCSYVTDRKFSPVKYYLLCHSIELSFKAFLLLKGVSRDEIAQKPYGHNLTNILEKCESLGFQELVDISKTQKSEIEELNKWYSRKGFEYFEIKNINSGTSTLPELHLVQQLAELLIECLKEPCKNEANKP